jgi:ferredoxin, 2Fe-2S
METALQAGVPGILADCGGSAACGTCRVFVDPAWQTVVGGPNDLEAAMLELGDSGGEGLRLSCQVSVTEEMNGLFVRLPASQF